MSGVELAGLLLGTFPLIISALENYSKLAEATSDWWRFKRVYTKWITDVRLHQLFFDRALEELLLPLIVDDKRLQLLKAEPLGLAWKDPDLEERLQERLSDSYDLYMQIIMDIQDVTEKLKKELGVDKPSMKRRIGDSPETASQNSRDLRKSVDYHTKRLKLSFSKYGRTKLLDALKEKIEQLERLLSTTDRNSALKHNAKRSLASVTIERLCRHAQSIYDLMLNAWVCACRSSHLANIRLNKKVPDGDFGILFLFDRQCEQSQKPWVWKSTTIKFDQVLEKPNANLTVQMAPLSTPSQLNDSSSVRPTSILRASKRASSSTIVECATPRLAYRQVSWEISASSLTQNTYSTSSSKQTSGEPAPVPIKDLCEEISKAGHASTCLGLLANDQFRYTISTLPDYGKPNKPSYVSLDKLLKRDSPLRLKRRSDRFSIALALASSHQILFSTPWLNGRWKKPDIIFLRDDGSPSGIVPEPYLMREFATSNPSPQFEEAFSSLGIVLLELCFGTALEENSVRLKYPADADPFLDLAAALQWSQEVLDEAGEHYDQAVSWCLKAGKAERCDWKKSFEESVIEPLRLSQLN
ncbi:hypothetical protein BDY21DRAFT_13767 [Lineolata rhizophorae]|uniref:DUF7580 domain-containing protein n=1 Tax=Lineolata rhizophorae TaxID=578093 RepID=A0A6A6PGA7_9PEZI|nr:hypothetical protein BDY21DRAFT_13767 [Lineolata rhizophorae]